MKIYTKKGDLGQTDLYKERVDKSSLRIDLIGTIDEILAHILMLDKVVNDKDITEELNTIYDVLFTLNYEIFKNEAMTKVDSVSFLENKIDYYNTFLEPIREFIKLNQNEKTLWANFSRITTRKAERKYVLCYKEILNENSLKFLNRLSDYFFTLGRYLGKEINK
jgi:cob(I)alamin adenosyltransferase